MARPRAAILLVEAGVCGSQVSSSLPAGATIVGIILPLAKQKRHGKHEYGKAVL